MPQSRFITTTLAVRAVCEIFGLECVQTGSWRRRTRPASAKASAPLKRGPSPWSFAIFPSCVQRYLVGSGDFRQRQRLLVYHAPSRAERYWFEANLVQKIRLFEASEWPACEICCFMKNNTHAALSTIPAHAKSVKIGIWLRTAARGLFSGFRLSSWNHHQTFSCAKLSRYRSIFAMHEFHYISVMFPNTLALEIDGVSPPSGRCLMPSAISGHLLAFFERNLTGVSKQSQNKTHKMTNGVMPHNRLLAVVFGERKETFGECASEFCASPDIKKLCTCELCGISSTHSGCCFQVDLP